MQRGALITRQEGERFAAPDRVRIAKAEFSYASLAIGDDGTKVVAWTERIDGRWRARAVIDEGSGWGEPIDVEGEGEQRAPVVIAANGKAWIAFEERVGFESRIRLQKLR